MWWKMSLAVVLGVVLGFSLDYAVVAQTLTDKDGAKTTVEVISDTQGVDFGPYLSVVLQNIRKSLYSMIPQCEVTKKPVSTVITLKVRPDGTVWFVRIPPSKNYEFDGMALSAIEVNKPFAPLPAGYQGPSSVDLRLTFEYTP